MRTINQHVPVSFRYPVHFTRGSLAPDNPLLGETLGVGSKVLAVVDAGVAAHHRRLAPAIADYAKAWGLTLVAAPIEVPGGEAVKNDPQLIEHLHKAINAGGICRHSYSGMARRWPSALRWTAFTQILRTASRRLHWSASSTRSRRLALGGG
jgi:3-dehydroquinate synthase